MNKNNILCFYHANCTDGAASAAVIHKKYPQAELYPLSHGDEIPVEVKDKTVFIVDFSFNEAILKKFKSEAKEVFWYDHHKTIVPIQKALGWGVVDLGESGATLTWKQEFPGQAVPKILQYVKDKDIWEWKLPHSREVNMALREYEEVLDPKSALWKKFLSGIQEKEFQALVNLGKTIANSQKTRLKNGSQFGFEVDFHGHKAFAVNWPLESSEMGEYIYKELKYEVALLFFYTGKHWNFSLRSDRVDVSLLAAKYGGGGHPGAAGFRMEEMEWLIKLKK